MEEVGDHFGDQQQVRKADEDDVVADDLGGALHGLVDEQFDHRQRRVRVALDTVEVGEDGAVDAGRDALVEFGEGDVLGLDDPVQEPQEVVVDVGRPELQEVLDVGGVVW